MYQYKFDGFFSIKKAANKSTNVDLTAAAVADLSHVCKSHCIVRRLLMPVLVATVSTGNIVVTFRKRPTPGSAVGQSDLGTLTIPTAAVVGKTYYKDIQGVEFQPGDELICEVTTAAAGGGAAGQGLGLFVAEEDPETASNESHMIASA